MNISQISKKRQKVKLSNLRSPREQPFCAHEECSFNFAIFQLAFLLSTRNCYYFAIKSSLLIFFLSPEKNITFKTQIVLLKSSLLKLFQAGVLDDGFTRETLLAVADFTLWETHPKLWTSRFRNITNSKCKTYVKLLNEWYESTKRLTFQKQVS